MPRHDPLIRPPALVRGDRVRVIAPASPFDRARFEKGVAALRAMGWEPVWREDLFDTESWLAGSDERRAAELVEAFEDPETKGIFCARGGYGSPRILPRLDLPRLARTPKVLVGFSDVTALLLAFHAQAGMVGFHGPLVTGRMAEPGLEERERDSLARTVGRSAPAGVVGGGVVLMPGSVEGPLLGGNLALVTALLGTRWSPDYTGAILFLEDVGEKPYRIDRMWTQLVLAGVIERVAGIALGRFSGCENPADPSQDVASWFARAAREAGKPCLWGLPFGHDGENNTLPVGVRARIEAPAGGTPGALSVTEAAVAGPLPVA